MTNNEEIELLRRVGKLEKEVTLLLQLAVRSQQHTKWIEAAQRIPNKKMKELLLLDNKTVEAFLEAYSEPS